jgi:hypothetical protein
MVAAVCLWLFINDSRELNAYRKIAAFVNNHEMTDPFGQVQFDRPRGLFSWSVPAERYSYALVRAKVKVAGDNEAKAIGHLHAFITGTGSRLDCGEGSLMADVYYEMGNRMVALKNSKVALEMYKESLRCDPRHPKAGVALERLFQMRMVREGDSSEAALEQAPGVGQESNNESKDGQGRGGRPMEGI